MPKFKPKVVNKEIDAMQFTGNNQNQIEQFLGRNLSKGLEIHGNYWLPEGDWIDSDGKVIRDDKFQDKYEPV